jgi:hypothetical protein
MFYVIIFIIILLFLILKYYLKYNEGYMVIQTFLNNIKSNDILFDKYPILIYDKIVNTNDILKSLFAYNYLTKKNKLYKNNTLIYNKSKFSLIQCDEDCIIDIINPKYKKYIKNNSLKDSDNVQYISIKLKKKQLLIIPLWWIYNSDKPINVIELDDIITLITSIIK